MSVLGEPVAGHEAPSLCRPWRDGCGGGHDCADGVLCAPGNPGCAQSHTGQVCDRGGGSPSLAEELLGEGAREPIDVALVVPAVVKD